MTDEQELHQMIIDHIHTNDDGTSLLKAIISAGWVKAEKIWEGNTGKNEYQKLYTAMNRNIEVYIREVKAWVIFIIVMTANELLI